MIKAVTYVMGLWMGFVGVVPQVLAQATPSVVVSPMGGSSSQAAVQAIVSELLSDGRLSVVPQKNVQSFMSQYAGQASPVISQQAYAFFQQGQKAFDNLNMKEAVDFFQKSERLYQNMLRDQDTFRAYRSVKFNLSRAFLALGRKQEAKAAMLEVIRLDPDRSPDKLSESEDSPEDRKLYKEAYAQLMDGPKGNVLLQAEPADARVYVDGKDVGSGQVQLQNMPLGKHYFRVVKSGFEEQVLEQFVVAGQNRVKVTLKPKQDQSVLQSYFETVESTDQMGEARIEFLDQMGVTLGADIFLLLSPLKGEVRGQLFDQRSQELSGAIASDQPKQLIAGLMRYIGSDGYVLSADQVPAQAAATQADPTKTASKPNAKTNQNETFKAKKSKNEVNKPFYKKWWFWTAIGVVVVGAGGGVYASGALDGDVDRSTLTTNIP